MKLVNSRAYIEIYKENNIELLAKVEDAMLLELRMFRHISSIFKW